MKRVPGLALVLLLAACAKQEPPASASANIANPTPPPPPVSAPIQPSETGDSTSAVAPKAPPVLTTATLTTTPAALGQSAPVAKPSVPPDGLPSEASAKEGAAIFTQICATCHMADGYGVPYLQPKIKGSAWISNPDPQPLLSLILRGSAILGEASKAYENDMAPQDHLSDAEIAVVASYVRQRFAATPITEPVTPAQVALARSRPGLP